MGHLGVIYTSGTTGPSKGVLQTYLQIWTTGRCTYGYMTPDDRMLINLPMFHVSGTGSLYAAVTTGASLALKEGFSTQRFWDDLRETGSTTTAGLIGAMADFLAKTEPRADDADNPLRWVCMTPINANTVALAKRFDFGWHSGFNMSEISAPLVTPVRPTTEMSCGRPRVGVEVRIVDEHDLEVAVGQVGELIVRSDLHVDDDARLSEHAGGDGAGVAQRLVPHRRRLPARRRGRILFRRPDEGHHPPARREHLVVRGRSRDRQPSGGAGRRRRRGAERAWRGGDPGLRDPEAGGEVRSRRR